MFLDKTFSTEYTEAKADRRGQRKQSRFHAKRKDEVDAEDVEEHVVRRKERLEALTSKKKHIAEDSVSHRCDNTQCKYFPPRLWKQLQQNATPSSDVEKPRSTARELYECVLNGDPCLIVPECHIRAAARELLALKADQRPAKISSLATHLKRRGCCVVRSAALVTPDMLLAALPAALEGKGLDDCKKQFEILAKTVQSNTLHCSVDCGQLAALRASKRLTIEVADDLAQMNFKAKARWICQHSWGTLEMQAGDIVQEMVARAFLRASEDGKKIYYNNEKLNSMMPELPQVDWSCDDVSFLASDCLENRTEHVMLGDAYLGIDVAKLLRRQNLRSVARRWWLAASAEFTELLADVEIWTETWTKDEEWCVVCAIDVHILRVAACLSDSIADENETIEAVMNNLQKVAEGDIVKLYAQVCAEELEKTHMASLKGGAHCKDAELRRELDEDVLDAKIKSGHLAFNASKRW